MLGFAVFGAAACQYSERPAGEGTVEVIAKSSSAITAETLDVVVATPGCDVTVPSPACVVRTDHLARTGSNAWTGTLGKLHFGEYDFHATATVAAATHTNGATHTYAADATNVTIDETAPTALVLNLQEVGGSSHGFANATPRVDSLFVSSTSVAPGAAVDFTLAASDADQGDTLKYAWVTKDSGGNTINCIYSPSRTGTFAGATEATTWSAPSTPGTYTVSATVTDYDGGGNARGGKSGISFTIDVAAANGRGSAAVTASVNLWPVVDAITTDSSNVVDGSQVHLTATTSDADHDSVSYQWSSDCGTFDDDESATPTFTVDGDADCAVHVDIADHDPQSGVARGGSGGGSLTLPSGVVDFAPFITAPSVTGRSPAFLRDAYTFIVTANDPDLGDPSGISVAWTYTDSDGNESDSSTFVVDTTPPVITADHVTFTAGWAVQTCGGKVTAKVTSGNLTVSHDFALTGASRCNRTVTTFFDDGGPGTLRDIVQNRQPNAAVVFSNDLDDNTNHTISLDWKRGPIVVPHGKSIEIDRPNTAQHDYNVTITNDGSGADATGLFDIGTHGTSLTLVELILQGNHGASAAVFNDGTFIATDVEFSSNSSTGNGAAIRGDTGSTTTLKSTTNGGCTFDQNTAGGNGGAVYIAGTNNPPNTNQTNVTSLSVTDCSFTTNASTGAGGALYLQAVNSISFTHDAANGDPNNGGLNNNVSYNHGGSDQNGQAIVIRDRTVATLDTLFASTNGWLSGQTASSGGGVLAVIANNGQGSPAQGTQVSITKSDLQGNNAGTGGGGAIYTQSAQNQTLTLSVDSTSFSNNVALGAAGNGGAIAAGDGKGATTLNVGTNSACTFSDNSADNNGGAIFVVTNQAGTVTGALGSSSTADGSATSFTGNTAAKNGGAIHFLTTSTTAGANTLTVQNTLFSGNAADNGSGGGGDGGAINCDGSGAKATVTGTLFTGNKTNANGGAVHITGDCAFSAVNVTFQSNDCVGASCSGTAVQSSNPNAEPAFSFCTFADNNTSGGPTTPQDEIAAVSRSKGTIRFKASILEDFTPFHSQGNNANNAIKSDGWNYVASVGISTAGGNDFLAKTGTGADVINASLPGLGALADHHGPTQTMSLCGQRTVAPYKWISTANACKDIGGNTVPTDQRGHTRSLNCSSGAYEEDGSGSNGASSCGP